MKVCASLRRLILALVCVAALPGPAAASGAPRWSTEQLASFADVVMIARVEDLTAGWDAETNSIYTYVTVEVEQVLKGTVPQSRVVIKQMGGRVGRVGLHVADQADFEVGETVLLFLEVRPRDGTLYTSALWQGKWTVDGDRRSRYAIRQEPAHSSVGAIEEQTLDAVERVVARASRSRAASRPIEFAPAGRQYAPAASATSTHAFTLLGPLRYLYSPSVDMQSGGQPGLPGGGIREVVSAIMRWNNAGSTFRYGLGSPDIPARCTTQELGNGRVTISFMDPCQEMSNAGGTLAIGGSYYLNGGAGSVDGEEFNRASEGFIMTNDGDMALQYLTRSGCFEDVATHELGHVLGLGHSLDPNAIMFPSIAVGCQSGPRELGADDIAGLTYIYGFRQSTRATAPSTAPPHVMVTVDGTTSVTVAWGAVEALNVFSLLPATSYRVDFRRGHQDGGPVLASFTTRATTVTVAIPPGLSGDFNVIVTPVNADGGGPASFRRDFTICGALPPPVTGLAAGVANGVARVTWNASPEAASYRASAGSSPGAADVYPLTELGAVTGIEAPVGDDFEAWVRVIAVNACGSSDPAEVLVSRRR